MWRKTNASYKSKCVSIGKYILIMFTKLKVIQIKKVCIKDGQYQISIGGGG